MAQRWGITNILLKHKKINLDMVKSIQTYAIENSVNEYDAITNLKLMTEEEVADLLSEVFNLHRINLEEVNFQEDVVNIIPYEVCQKLILIAVEVIENKKLLFAVNDPSNITALETLKFYTDREIEFAVATKSSILRSVQLMYSQHQNNSAVDEISEEFRIENSNVSEDDSKSDEPTIKLTNSILNDAYVMHASDIHIEPYENKVIVRYRIDGKLKEMMKLPVQVFSAIATRFKMISGMDIAERRLPQEGRIDMKIHEKSIDVRVSTLPNTFGEKIVMRLLEKSNLSHPKEKLGFQEGDLRKINKMLSSPNGLILVTGPTGSGKSTTLYSFLNSLKSPEKAIVTVEDPVEYTIEGINQTPVNVKQGMTFPIALRSILRQDPDIIMIGEIRDEETASIAVRGSITGHLVLSTIHTNDSVTAVARLSDMGIEPYLIADALRGVIAQRLMRAVCPFCGEEYLSSLAEMNELGITRPARLIRAGGCRKCNYTGFKGRFGIYEVLILNDELKNLIELNVPSNQLREAARESGLESLRSKAIDAVLDGRTTVTELRGLIYEI